MLTTFFILIGFLSHGRTKTMEDHVFSAQRRRWAWKLFCYENEKVILALLMLCFAQCDDDLHFLANETKDCSRLILLHVVFGTSIAVRPVALLRTYSKWIWRCAIFSCKPMLLEYEVRHCEIISDRFYKET